MRFHVVGLPHTVTSKEYNACAYTQKVLLFCKMMTSLGHTVIHYGSGSPVGLPCTEHVCTMSEDTRLNFFSNNDWRRETFKIKWNPDEPYWQVSNINAAVEIRKRIQKRDFICLIGGNCQKPIYDKIGETDTITVEFGVGYYGVFSKYKVFESYAHQGAVYGMLSKDPNGNLYDAVISNYYDPEDFPMGNLPIHNRKYLLYLGRITTRKGVQIALDISKSTGLKLVLAGQGIVRETNDHWETEEGWAIPKEDLWRCVGYADVERRGMLMEFAKALIAPTLYLEPFGGVAVEAQMCGTPAITTDYGGFSETVINEKTGFRCSTLQQFCKAVERVDGLDPQEIGQLARQRYSIYVVRYKYEDYFHSLYNLWDRGWYT